jgi:hypothetical protein
VLTRLLILGVLATALACTVVVGRLLSAAAGEIAAVASVFGEAAGRAPQIALGVSESARALNAASAPTVPSGPTPQASSRLPDIAADESSMEDAVHLFDENEFELDYFGDELSLNDLGQLETTDPEFEREIRALANEIGEIQERN